MKHLQKTDLKQVRSLLRPLFKAGRLEARQVYYDYYDSCHAPNETPDAPWTEASRWVKEDDLKAGGMSISIKSEGLYQLYTGYKTVELRVK